MNKITKYLLHFICFFVILLATRSIHWIYHLFKRVNFDEIAIVLSTGATGTDSELFWSFIKDCVILAGIIALIITMICYIFRSKRYVKICMYLLCFAFFIFETSISNIELGSFFNFQKSNFYETEYIDPKNVEITWEKKRNVLFIALESIEKSYGNPNIFNEILTPEITELERKNK